MKSTEQKFLALVYALDDLALGCLPCNGTNTIFGPVHATVCQACQSLCDVIRKHKPDLGIMGLETPVGSKVVFHNPRYGRSGDIHTARKHLEIGKTYTVADMQVFDSSSNVYLAEVPGVAFNTVQFVNAPLVFP